jgi:hypothetical protein
MEDLLSIIVADNHSVLNSTNTNVMIGNWLLYSITMFVDLLCALVAMVLIHDTVRSFIVTKRATDSSHPINLYKYIVMCFAATLFLRSSMDAVMLVSWGEVSLATMIYLIDLDRIFDALATIPFLIFAYLVIRGGPVIEFQLLRRPIPTDLHPTWKMMRKPILSFLTILILCVVITLTK